MHITKHSTIFFQKKSGLHDSDTALRNEDNRPRILLGIIEEVKYNMLRTRTHVHYYYYIDALQAKSIVFSNLFKLT